MRIPVMDAEMRQLMPTTPTRARLLLKNGQASPYWNKLGVFCIILKKEVKPDNQPIALGIDPGSKFEGWSIVGTQEVVLNGMSEAPHHVKKSLEVRHDMRRSRRFRNCWRRPARFHNRLRNKKSLPPSTHARWNAKLRILDLLRQIIPITDVVVEDVKAVTKKGVKRWNKNFSPLEQGKTWFYAEIVDRDLKLHLKQGFETKGLRDEMRLKKTSQKSKKAFSSHCVDAFVLARSVVGGALTERGLYYWTPIRLHRRQLHRFQPKKGGIRLPYGGTRSMGLTRGTLVRHPKHGLSYVGGSSKGNVSLHNIISGKRITQTAKVLDLTILTVIRWRAQFLPALKGGVSLRI